MYVDIHRCFLILSAGDEILFLLLREEYNPGKVEGETKLPS